MSTVPIQTPRFDGGIFSRLLDAYAKAPDKHTAGERIVDLIDTSPVLRKETIAVTFIDRLIFFAIVTLMRQAVLAATSWLVHRGVLRTLRAALIAYGVAYTTALLLLYAAVYLSDSTLRIAINYINPHANTSYLVIHLFITWMVLLVGISVLFAEKGGASPIRARMSEADKNDIINNVVAITYFMWIILSIQILFMS